MRAFTKLRALIAIWACAGAPFAAAQPAPLPAPNLDIRAVGNVEAVVRLADGSIIVGGYFSTVFDPASQISFPREGLAKILPNGNLDLAWQPSTGGTYVGALVLDGDMLYVGGSFASLGGQPRNGLARISTTGTGQADPQWNPGCNGQVDAIAVQDGNVFVGGRFTQAGGVTVSNLAKLSASGSGAADPAWTPAANDIVEALVADATAVYVGGGFTSINGVSRRGVARLASAGAGAVEATWAPLLDCPIPGYCVRALALAPGGAQVYVAGAFSQVNGGARFGVARFSSSGALDAAWDPQVNSYAESLALDGAGRLYVGGSFGIVGGAARSRIARVSTSGSGAVDLAWDNPVDSVPTAIAADANGESVIVGNFSRVQDQVRFGVARLVAGGPPPVTALVQFNGIVRQIVVASDGSYFVAGNFQRAGALARRGLMKVSAAGVVDPQWNPDFTCSYSICVESIALAADGAVYAAGEFTAVGGVPQAYVAKLASSGTGAAVSSWNPVLNDGVSQLAVGPDGSLYAAGVFATAGGQPHPYLARILANGSVDAAWTPPPPCSGGGCITKLEVDPVTGDLYVLGTFTTVGGQARNGLARFAGSGTGALDLAWDPAPDDDIHDLAFDGGQLYVTGAFSSIGGQPRNKLARLATAGTGAADPTWSPSVSIEPYALALDGSSRLYVSTVFNVRRVSTVTGVVDSIWAPPVIGVVADMKIAPSGAILVSGNFTSISDTPRLLLAALPPVVDPIFANGFE